MAIKAEIQNWRWAGVPFFLRTGKRMQEQLAEIMINFRSVPLQLFSAVGGTPNRLVIRLAGRRHPPLSARQTARKRHE